MYKGQQSNQNPLLICFCSEKIFLSGSAGNKMHPSTPSVAALPSLCFLPGFLFGCLCFWPSRCTHVHICRALHLIAPLCPCCEAESKSLWAKGRGSVTGRCQVPDGQRWALSCRSINAGKQILVTRELSILRKG